MITLTMVLYHQEHGDSDPLLWSGTSEFSHYEVKWDGDALADGIHGAIAESPPRFSVYGECRSLTEGQPEPVAFAIPCVLRVYKRHPIWVTRPDCNSTHFAMKRMDQP
jgi:hypothetical protein